MNKLHDDSMNKAAAVMTRVKELLHFTSCSILLLRGRFTKTGEAGAEQHLELQETEKVNVAYQNLKYESLEN